MTPVTDEVFCSHNANKNAPDSSSEAITSSPPPRTAVTGLTIAQPGCRGQITVVMGARVTEVMDPTLRKSIVHWLAGTRNGDGLDLEMQIAHAADAHLPPGFDGNG